MTSTSPTNESTSLLGNPTGELVLRIRGTSRDGQELRLTEGKLTFGSASYCNVRLQSEGVHPMHCLVVRGEGSTVARRWSPETRLNGGEFDVAPLSSGDVLSIGPVDLEVVAIDDVENAIADAERGNTSPSQQETSPAANATPRMTRSGVTDGDDSIYDYMHQLLERARGCSENDELESMHTGLTAGGTDYSPQSQGQAYTLESVMEGNATPNASAADEPAWDVASMSPRILTPDAHAEMEALRDLTEDEEVDQSLFRRWKAAAIGNALMSALSFAAGVVLVLNANNEMSTTFLSGTAALVGAIYWSVQCGLLMKHAKWLHAAEEEDES